MNHKIEFSPMKVYYGLIILLKDYSFPRVIYFHSYQTKYGHFQASQIKLRDRVPARYRAPKTS